jgi:hypothetical protein
VAFPDVYDNGLKRQPWLQLAGSDLSAIGWRGMKADLRVREEAVGFSDPERTFHVAMQ